VGDYQDSSERPNVSRGWPQSFSAWARSWAASTKLFFTFDLLASLVDDAERQKITPKKS
jgi:uncharacterized protein (DUF1800 family)